MGSGGSTEQVRRRDYDPEEERMLKNLREGLYNATMPSLQSFSPEEWNRAKITAYDAMDQQSQFMREIPSAINQQNKLGNLLAYTAETGNLPTGLTDSMNFSVNQELKSGMGEMLNNLGSKGIINSSIASQGINSLSQQAADAYNRNYMTAYQTALNGMSNALRGQQNNVSSLLSTVRGVGDIPTSIYENVATGITPAMTLWKDWQGFHDNREDYDTVVRSK